MQASAPLATRLRPAVPSDETAVLGLLRSHKGLEVAFEASEFVVATQGGRIVACGRLRRHTDGALELASVATSMQGAGLGSLVVGRLLEGRRGPVYALALAPGFFERHGFAAVAKESLPATVRAKADGLCASTGFVPMVRP